MSDIFPLNNSWLLLTSFLLSTAAILLNVNNRNRAALLSLFFAALTVRLFMAHLDPFLHDWDERYHALVARNMMHDPFKPMLIAQPYMPYDYKLWSGNHVWLHKQPLFLWQMALSMKTFGVSVFTMRYPSVLMGALSVLLLYRIAVIATKNHKIAFIAALLACYSYLALEMTSGYKGIDHNDLAFQFYVLASVWTFAEYRRSHIAGWALITGLFAGCAVLNKWLPGLLVFAGWAVNMIVDARKKSLNRNELMHFVAAVAIACIVFIPWQLYTLHTFPTEARYELNYNSAHILRAVEGHKGDGWYYIDLFHEYFGGWIWGLVIVGLISLTFLKQYHNKLMSALTVNFILAFIFFSFIVPTKMDGFFMVVVPLGYLFMAVAIFHLLTGKGSSDTSRPSVSFELSYNDVLKGGRKYAYVIVMILIAQTLLNLPEVTEYHDPKNDRYSQRTRIRNNEIFASLMHTMPKNVKVVLNAGNTHDIDVMFYNNNVTAYAWNMDEETFNKNIKNKNVPIAVFAERGDYRLPAYVKDYPHKYMINEIVN